MRKNPREDTKWLEEALLAMEEEEQTEPAEEDDLPWWQEVGESPNPGWSYGLYEDEEFDESAAVEAPTRKQQRRQKKLEKQQQKEEKLLRKKKKKGIGGLVLLAMAELAAIFAIIGWWIEWLT